MHKVSIQQCVRSMRSLVTATRFCVWPFVCTLMFLSASVSDAQVRRDGFGRPVPGIGQNPGMPVGEIGSKWERDPQGDHSRNFGQHHGHAGYNSGIIGMGAVTNFGWNAGLPYGHNYYPGGQPWIAPPVYIRNSDGAVFGSPGSFVPYGVGPEYGWPVYDPWFFAANNGGFYPGYGVDPGYGGYGMSYGLMPVPGIVPSFLNLNIGIQGYGSPRLRSSSAAWAIVPRSSEAMQPGLLPPRMKVTPLPPGAELVPDSPPEPQQEDTVPIPGDASGPPILNEFRPVVPMQKRVALQDKLQSIRFQANGDEAFRSRDFAAAQVYYESAIEAAPARRTPYLRMAFVCLSRSKFELAVAYLKTGLTLESDSTRSWITAQELLGDGNQDQIRNDSRRLWQWVAKNPLSTDRLLLTGAFQKWRGMHRTADDILSTVAAHDPESGLPGALDQLIAEDHEKKQALSLRRTQPVVRNQNSPAAASDEQRPVQPEFKSSNSPVSGNAEQDVPAPSDPSLPADEPAALVIPSIDE